MDKYKFQKEDFTDIEIWFLETMIVQMENLVLQLDKNPIWTDVVGKWYGLKEKMGWNDPEF